MLSSDSLPGWGPQQFDKQAAKNLVMFQNQIPFAEDFYIDKSSVFCRTVFVPEAVRISLLQVLVDRMNLYNMR